MDFNLKKKTKSAEACDDTWNIELQKCAFDIWDPGDQSSKVKVIKGRNERIRREIERPSK